MERKTSRQIQAENTKKRILDTVSLILQKKSYEEMSILEICDRAGISVGAFYHHFENKAALIVELYRDVDSYFEHEVYDRVKDMEPEEAVITFIREQCRYGVDIGVEMTINVYKAQIDNGNEFFISSDRGLARCLLALLGRMEEKGMFVDGVNIEALRDELLIIARGNLYNWCINGGRTDILGSVTKMVGGYLRAFCR